MKCPICGTEMDQRTESIPNLAMGAALGNIALGFCFQNTKTIYECPKCHYKREY